jgi:hypothetical protein
MASTRCALRQHILRLLLALVLLGAQIAAIAHEFDHALGNHASVCALHVFADHAGKALSGAAQLCTQSRTAPLAFSPVAVSAGLVSFPPFQGRAPPFFL